MKETVFTKGKRQYEKPEITVICMLEETAILAGSGVSSSENSDTSDWQQGSDPSEETVNGEWQ